MGIIKEKVIRVQYSPFEHELQMVPDYVVRELVRELKKEYFWEVGLWSVLCGLIPLFHFFLYFVTM